MKTAQYKYVETYNGKTRSVYATVTLKYDGKVSVSILDAKHYSAAMRYQAKQLGLKIVEAGFVHPAVISLQVMGGELVGLLTDKTKELHDRWIQKTKEYSVRFFAYSRKMMAQTKEQWYELYSVKTEQKPYGVGGTMVNVAIENSEYYEMRRAKNKYSDVLRMGFEKFRDSEVKAAEQHYTDCIWKLSDRLEKKGVKKTADLQVRQAWIGPNLDMWFKYNDISIHAWTIIAEGPIQRAHYRYLVK